MNARKSIQPSNGFYKRISAGRRSDREMEIIKQAELVKELQIHAAQEQARLTAMMIDKAA